MGHRCLPHPRWHSQRDQRAMASNSQREKGMQLILSHAGDIACNRYFGGLRPKQTPSWSLTSLVTCKSDF